METMVEPGIDPAKKPFFITFSPQGDGNDLLNALNNSRKNSGFFITFSPQGDENALFLVAVAGDQLVPRFS
jgi:hypothetical protein